MIALDQPLSGLTSVRLMSDFAARIRAARAYAGLTQRQLAERLGIDEQTIKRREAGAQDPKRGELLAIAAICNVPTAFMEYGFGEIDENEVLSHLARIESELATIRLDSAAPSRRQAPSSTPARSPRETGAKSSRSSRGG